MAKNLCPFDLDRRPCMEHDCALFIQSQWQNDMGDVKQEWSCVFVASAKLQFQHVMEQARTQASVDKVANGFAAGFGGLMTLAGAAAKARELGAGKGPSGT